MSKSLWSRSVWNSLFNRVSGSRRLARRRPSQRTNWNQNVAAETLETRVVLAATSPVNVVFTDATDTLTLTSAAGTTSESVAVKAGATFTDVLVNGRFLTRLNGVDASGIDTIVFDGKSGTADSLSVTGITNPTLTVTLTGVEKLQLNLNSVDVTATSDGALALATSEVFGGLDLTAGGAVTQTGKVIVSGETKIIATGFDITLKTAGNSFGDLVLTGKDVSINEDGPTNLGGSAGVTTTGNLTVTSTGAITDSATISVAATKVTSLTSYGSSITLDEAASTYGGLITLKGTDIDITDTDATGTSLGAITATGNFTLTSSGDVSHTASNITVGGLATITAASAGPTPEDIDLTLGSNNFGSLQLSGANVQVTERSATDLSTTTATNGMTIISSGEITDSGVVTVTGATVLTATGNAITLDQTSTFGGVVTFTGTNVSFSDSNGTTLGTGSVARGNLTVTSGGTVDQNGSITVSGLASINAADNITMTSANRFGSVAVVGDTVQLTEFDGTDLYTSMVGVDLTVISGGTVTDSGVVAVTGLTTITAGTTGTRAITLDTAESTYGSTVALKGTNVSIIDSDGATELGLTTATGNLTVTTTGSGAGVSQTAGVLTVTGRFTVNAVNGASGVPDKDITLNNVTNGFGSVSFFGAVVQLKEKDATNLYTSQTVGGNFTLVSKGAVTDSGDLKIAGVTDITAQSGLMFFDIILDSPGSTFTDGATDLVLAGKNISVADHDAVTTLGNITANTAGTLTIITAGGSITDGGSITVPGKATFNANGGDITIDNATADAFTGAISLYGNNASLTTGAGTTTVNLGNSNVKDLAIDSKTAVIDSGTVRAIGAVTITATTSAGVTDKDVTLDSPLNVFGTVTLTAAKDVTIVENDATDLGISNVKTLLVKSNGAITDSGVLTVYGTTASSTNLTANNGAIDLDETSTFAGSIKLKASSDITITDGDATTDLALVTTPGNFSLNAGTGAAGTVLQSGAITVSGLASIDADTTITLTETGGNNNFGTLHFAGTAVNIKEHSNTDLIASTASTTLTLFSTGNITADSAEVVTAGGATSLTAGGASGNGSITLDATGDDFGDLLLKGSTVKINDATATKLDMGTVVKGALTLTSGGDVTETSTIQVDGLLTISTVGNDIILTGANTLNSLLINADDVQITDSVGNIVLGDALQTTDVSNITGVFILNSVGNVTDEGILNLTGTSTTIIATGSITLDEVGSAFTSVKLTAASITVYAYSDIDLAFIRAAAGSADSNTLTLKIIATGNITDSNGGAVPVLKSTGNVDIEAVGTLTLHETRSFTGTGSDTLFGAAGEDIT